MCPPTGWLGDGLEGPDRGRGGRWRRRILARTVLRPQLATGRLDEDRRDQRVDARERRDEYRTYPVDGDPALAHRISHRFTAAGIRHRLDEERGLDHGVFVPFKLVYPDASIPTVQVSLARGLDPATHLAIGRALAPLREEGVLIVGSGMSFHNMATFFSPGADRASRVFDRWLADSCEAPDRVRQARLTAWHDAPAARAAHPREEHLLPLMVVAGAADGDVGTTLFRDVALGATVSAHGFGMPGS